MKNNHSFGKKPDKFQELLIETINDYEVESKGVKLHNFIKQEFENCRKKYEEERTSSFSLRYTSFRYNFIMDSYTLDSVLNFLNNCLEILDFPKSLEIDQDLLQSLQDFNLDFKNLKENRPNFFYGRAVSSRIVTFIENQEKKDTGIGKASVYRLHFWKFIEVLINEGNLIFNKNFS